MKSVFTNPIHLDVNSLVGELDNCVFSAELRRSEAAALGHPVLPVFDGLSR
jgi:hypothetical protein